MTELKQHQSKYKGWLYKWTNYIKGYQKRWFDLQNGYLSYYRSKAEMAHTCRGTINLANAVIRTEDATTIIISKSGEQTFHLKATSEVERQKWVTALELAKSEAIKIFDAESDEDERTVYDKNELPNMVRSLASKLVDLGTCYDLICKHGVALQKALSELEQMGDVSEVARKMKTINERATLLRVTSNAMINACGDFHDEASVNGKRWQRLLSHEHDLRLKLEDMVEQMARDQNQLEKKARLSVKQDTIDEEDFFDALDNNVDQQFEVALPPNAKEKKHRRTISDLSMDSCSNNEECISSGSESEGSFDKVVVYTTKGCDRREGKRQTSRDSVSAEQTGLVGKSTMSTNRQPRVRRQWIPEKPNMSLNLWSIMKNCIGKELSKIPLPVNFNEPLSLLQRLTEGLEYSEILDRAATCDDLCEQLCHVAAFTVSSYATTLYRTGKPFNPLLGETYEFDRTEDLGWRSLAEQVSHHPPTAAICIEGRGWTMWQDFTMTTKFRGHYLQIAPMGFAHLVFHNCGAHYSWRPVLTTVHNFIVGRLWVDNNGEVDLVNHVTGDKCHLKYSTYSYFAREPPRKVSGVVTDCRGVARWVLTGTWCTKMEVAPIVHVDEPRNRKPIYKTGPHKLLWKARPPPPGSEKIYYFSQLAIEMNEMEDGVAPTDSRRRPDQRLMEDGKWEEANRCKFLLEEKQRAVRRRREAESENVNYKGVGGVYQPTWFRRESKPESRGSLFAYTGRYWECKAESKWDCCPDIFF